MSEDQKRPPIKTLRDGAVVVKLWRQEGRDGPFVSATLGRTYQDKSTGEYRESRSLSSTDVLKGQALLQEAHREMAKEREQFRETAARQQPQGGREPDNAGGQRRQYSRAASPDRSFDR